MTPNPDKVAKALTEPVNQMLVAQVFAEALHEQVEDIDRRVLSERVYTNKFSGERVTEPRLSYLMGDEDAEHFLARRDAEIRAAGFNPPEGYCPALMAQHEHIKAERALIDAAEPFFGVSNDILWGENRTKWLDLLLKLVVNHPSYTPPTPNA
jgi:hypothetical protein